MVKWFTFKNKQFSSRQILYDYENAKWDKIYNIGSFDSISLNCHTYHLITSKGFFTVYDGSTGIVVRDFQETDDPDINSQIDDMIA